MCPHCNKEVREGMKAVSCESCGEWYHDKCIDLTGRDYTLIKRRNITWRCNSCINKKISPGKASDVNAGTGLERQLASIAATMTNLLDRMDSIEGRTAGPTKEVVEEMVSSKVDEAMEEAMRKIRNEKNLIVVNIPESAKDSPKDREKEDRDKMEVLLRKILPEAEKDELKISDQFRLGERNKSKRPRLIKLQMEKTSTKSKILKEYYNVINRKEGREIPLNDRVFFNKDQTKKERETDIKMKEELHRRREEGEKDLVIRGGRIIKDEGRDVMNKGRGNRGQFKDRNTTEKKNEEREEAGIRGDHSEKGNRDRTREKPQGERDSRKENERKRKSY